MSVKVGDEVAWRNVPDGALVRWSPIEGHVDFFYRRHEHVASMVSGARGWCAPGGDDGTFAPDEPVTIIAFGLTGRESAADIQRHAETFEIRKALRTEPGSLPGFTRVFLGDEMIGGFSGGDGLTYWAGRLHKAGVRAGMAPAEAMQKLEGSRS